MNWLRKIFTRPPTKMDLFYQDFNKDMDQKLENFHKLRESLEKHIEQWAEDDRRRDFLHISSYRESPKH